MWQTITINLHSWHCLCKVMRRLIHTWLHPDSEGSVHLTCIASPLKWKSPSREDRIQFNHTLRQAMSVSLALQIRSTSRCRTSFISWESGEETVSGGAISLCSCWTAEMKSLPCLKTTSESPHNVSDLSAGVYSSGHNIFGLWPRLLKGVSRICPSCC